MKRKVRRLHDIKLQARGSVRKYDPIQAQKIRSSLIFCLNKSLHKVFLFQPLKPRHHIWPPFTFIPIHQHRSINPHLMQISNYTSLFMPSSNKSISHTIIPLRRRYSSCEQQPIQHPSMRDIDILNRLRSFPAITRLFKKSSSPVKRQLWQGLGRKDWDRWRVFKGGENRGIPVNAGAHEVEDDGFGHCWGFGYC